MIEDLFERNSQRYQGLLHSQNLSDSQDMKPNTKWYKT